MLGNPTKISKDAINALPLRAYEGAVTVIRDRSAMLEAIKELSQQTLLGFDTESRPSFRRGDAFPASILQLATADHAFVFQMRFLGDLDPLFAILADPAILKVGVAIGDDIKKLQDLHAFEPSGFVELAQLAQKAGLENTGLRSLAALLLNFRISKGAQVSNWAKDSLSAAQVQYAATDAWVSRMLYQSLSELSA